MGRILSELACLNFILACFGVTIGFIAFNVKVLGRKLRRTANEDVRLLDESKEAKFRALSGTINGLITIEAAFASVTVAVLFVVVGIFVPGTVTLPEVIAPIVLAAITALAIATVCWILSLEMLSHLISPSFADEAFGLVYQEALNLWNLGLMLLLLSLCLVLIPVSTTVAASVTAVATLLSLRALALVHQWGPATLKKMPTQAVVIKESLPKTANPWIFSWGLAVIVGLLAPLYIPLNRPTEFVQFMSTPIDDLIPLWPVFVLPYLSYFTYILLTIIVHLVRKDRFAFERLFLSLLLTLAVSYLFYGFFQTGMHRPDLSASSGLFVEMLSKVYATDNPFNAFPSSHASITTVCCLTLLGWRQMRIAAVFWALLIIASTVLVKQHFLADAVAGVLLATLSFWIAGRLIQSRQEMQV